MKSAQNFGAIAKTLKGQICPLLPFPAQNSIKIQC